MTINHTFTFHIESLFICHKIVRFCLLGFAVKLAHSSWNEVVVACTSGVVFTDILTFKRRFYTSSLNVWPLRALPDTDLSTGLHCPFAASSPYIRDIRQIVNNARDILLLWFKKSPARQWEKNKTKQSKKTFQVLTSYTNLYSQVQRCQFLLVTYRSTAFKSTSY